MDRDTIAGEWMFSGIRDLLFAFSIEQRMFFRYSVFHQIMALEKILKGAVLFAHQEIYGGLPDDQALQAVEKEARHRGHDLREMLKELDRQFEPWSSRQVLAKTFGLTGEQLIEAAVAGYQETRYPTASPVYLRFKQNGSSLYRDPLNSTCTRDCIYELCREVLAEVKRRGGIVGLRQRVDNELLCPDVGTRFARVFFAEREQELI